MSTQVPGPAAVTPEAGGSQGPASAPLRVSAPGGAASGTAPGRPGPSQTARWRSIQSAAARRKRRRLSALRKSWPS